MNPSHRDTTSAKEGWGGMKLLTVGLCVGVVVAGCALVNSIQTGKPLTPAAIQADLANATYLMQASGCAVAAAGTTAAPIVAIAGGPGGEQILTAVDAVGNLQCHMVVPATALPIPAPANAPAATAAVVAN